MMMRQSMVLIITFQRLRNLIISLNVRFQLVMVMDFKVLQTKQPKHMYNMFPAEYTYNTSQARSKSIKQTGHPTLDFWKDSFIPCSLGCTHR